MANVTLNSTANSNSIYKENATYLSARSGVGTGLLGIANSRIGQRLLSSLYQCYETLLEFDLTPYPTANFSASVLTLYDQFNDVGVNFTARVFAYDYGTSITTADFSNLALYTGTGLANKTTTGQLDATTLTFTETGLSAALVPGALNRFIIVSDRAYGASPTAPTANEYYTIYSNDVTHPAQLALTYTLPTGSVDPFGMLGFFGQ